MNEIHRRWGSNIATRRKALKMTQAELARCLDVEQSTVARWEAGVRIPRDQYKVELATVLGRSVRNLFPLEASV